MVVSDLDGTLFNNENHPTEKNIIALQRLQKEGVPVVIASGRSLSAMTNTKATLQMEIPMVGFNGSIVVSENNRLIASKPLSMPLADSVVALAREFGHLTNWYVGVDADSSESVDTSSMGVHAVCESDSHSKLASRYSDLTGMTYTFVDGYKGLLIPPKLVVLTGEEHAKIFADRARDVFDSSQVKIIQDKWFVEFIAPDIHKASALSSLLSSSWNTSSIEMAQICAFGDGPNDTELLSQVGYGVAMANAVDDAKTAAKKVSLHANTNDAVARELHCLILNGHFRTPLGHPIDNHLLTDLFS